VSTHRASVKVAYRPLFSLSAAVQDPATAGLNGNRFVLLGGLTAADTSTANVTVADLHAVRARASLPGAQHDAQAATIGGQVYVFGGGQFSQYNHILRFDPSANSISPVGTLPSGESDVAVAQLNGTAYVVGGFDGSNSLSTIVAWRPGGSAHVVGHLRVALRYAAVTAANGSILVIGGSTPAGASSAIYRFNPTRGTVQQIGRLPQATTHAGAAVLGSMVYLVGGRGDSLTSRTAAVQAIDPATGKVTAAGKLPAPTSDAGVVGLGNAIVVAGGHTPSATQAGVGELVPAA
jgi:N-acetylneuraminic acid mutarotase